MIKKILISRIDEAIDKDFLSKNNINYIISFLDPDYLQFVYQKLIYDLGYTKDNWKYFLMYDLSHETTVKDKEKGPQKEQVLQLISIFDDLINNNKNINLLIHCTAGISRSTAAAYILFYLIYKDYDKALQKLIENRPCCNPNILILKYADEILNTDMKNFIKNNFLRK